MFEANETVQQLTWVEQDALNTLEQVISLAELRQWRSMYLGSKGVIRALLNDISNLPQENRANYSAQVNRLKNRLATACDTVETQLQETALAAELESGAIDITLPGRSHARGHYHPSTITLRRFYHIWSEMGFQIYRSREVENEAHNFDLLNFPKDHPARDMQDTFYTTDDNVVLRSQTSPGQVRAMRGFGANGTKPLRLLLPGMVYRYEDITVRNDIQFHQVEGLARQSGAISV
jgi:phenylalanyl-tRNA synthetase alpha chain